MPELDLCKRAIDKKGGHQTGDDIKTFMIEWLYLAESNVVNYVIRNFNEKELYK